MTREDADYAKRTPREESTENSRRLPWGVSYWLTIGLALPLAFGGYWLAYSGKLSASSSFSLTIAVAVAAAGIIHHYTEGFENVN